MSNTMDSTVLGVCKQCDKPFSYRFLGRTKWFCPDCNASKALVASKKHRERMQLQPGELRAISPAGLASIAKITQRHAAARLCVWETLELVKKTGDPNAEARIISEQAVQQLERSALLKIRKALLPYWLQYKQDLIEASRKIAHPGRTLTGTMQSYYPIQAEMQRSC